jgi:DNA-binding NarL/FixJ family response regulator
MPDAPKRPIILVVDDATDTLGMMSAILEKAGMTALVAQDGRSALALLEHAVPDLILMDALMPRMDGFEAVRALKRDQRFAHIPVIFLTGLSEPENMVKGLELGSVDYITKPIVPEVMLARVRTHLGNSRLANSARRALDVSGTPLLAVNAHGQLLWMTPQALQRLDGGDWRTTLAPLLAEVVAGRLGDAPLTHGGLFVSFIGESQPGEYLLRLKEAGAPSESALLKQVFALTDREAEVLVWIAKGKSNKDVAEILGCSPRTINKHLEQIYQKLDVENRTSAAMRAIQVVSEN